MKRFAGILVLSLILVLLLQSPALGEKIGKEYTIDGQCSFMINSIKSYNVFFNQESGSTKQWIVVSFHLLNWRNDQFFVKTSVKAQMIYDDDYEYSTVYLWANPEGSYYSKSANNTLYIYSMDDSGKIISNGTDTGSGYERAGVKYSSGYVRTYDPINDAFYYLPDTYSSPWAYPSTDPSKTILDPLVQRTYHYVFQVPDLVANEEGARELVFTVCGEEYTFRF